MPSLDVLMIIQDRSLLGSRSKHPALNCELPRGLSERDPFYVNAVITGGVRIEASSSSTTRIYRPRVELALLSTAVIATSAWR